MIERKYDPIFTRGFERAVRHAYLDEFEKEIVTVSIRCFCASLDKSAYHPVASDDGTTLYEFEIQAIFRRFVVIFEVDGIDAYALYFEEL